MRDGFISVAAGTPKIRGADCRYNAEQIFTLMREADKQGVKVLALPELCLTGYTCGDLFLQDTLLRGAEEGLQTILEATRNLEIVTALGLPVWDKWDNKLYNCAAIIQKGEILGLIPKVYLPNYGEFYEQRWFASGSGVEHGIELCGQHVSLCTNQTFACDTMPNLVIGVEICEDLWAPAPPSVELARKGATVILNLSASNELVGKADYRRSLVTGQSARLMCGYVYADAGEGESTTDVVFTGHNMIAENGTLLAERRFATGLTVSEIDVDRLIHDRRPTNTFTFGKEPPEIWRCGFTLPVEETRLTRYVSPSPFVPEDAAGRAERCEEILRIASLGLKKRLEHTGVPASPELNAMLEGKGTAPVANSARLADLLRRPQVSYADIAPFDPERPELSLAVTDEVEIQIKYAGYLTRQEKQVEEFKKEEARLLPDDLDYAAIPGLRLEAREKLAAIRPVSIGQAGRISGVSPADIAVLLIYLEQTNG